MSRSDWRRKYAYSVGEKDIDRFVDGNPSVKSFLGRYEHKGSTWFKRARALALFFSWLRISKSLELTPKEFLLELARKRSQEDGKTWGRDLVLEFSRDNKDFKGRSWSYQCGMMFSSVKAWCDFNEVPLTSAKAVFGRRNRRQFAEPAFTVDMAKKVLACLNQRDRAICMTMLQSGQSTGQILEDVNGRADYIIREIGAGKTRIRLDFDERKGNGFAYFTFISVDAIQEIREWLEIRAKLSKESNWLFTTEKGEQLTSVQFRINFRQRLQRHKLWTGPFSVRPHMFRKIFGQEASPPDRGINRDYVAFMKGHSNGVGGNGLDSPGGVYDKEPFIDPAVVEGEYAKLEPYINIYSGAPGKQNEEIAGMKAEIKAMQMKLLEWAGRIEGDVKGISGGVVHKV